MDVYDAIKERHSVRRYKDKDISHEDLTKILDAGRKIQSAGNINTIRFIVVNEKEKKKELVKASHHQNFIANSPVIIIVCSDMNRIKQAYGDDASAYSKQQSGAAMQNMALEAVNLKLSSCIIQGFNKTDIKKIFKIPENIDIEALLTIGYSDSVKEERIKYELDKIVHLNEWKV